MRTWGWWQGDWRFHKQNNSHSNRADLGSRGEQTLSNPCGEQSHSLPAPPPPPFSPSLLTSGPHSYATTTCEPGGSLGWVLMGKRLQKCMSAGKPLLGMHVAGFV